MFKKIYSKILFSIIVIISAFINIAHAAKSTCNPQSGTSSMIVDGKTGKILHSSNAKNKIFPASLTKILTLYMTFDAIESGKLSMNQRLYVSKNAEKMPPTKLGLKAGEYITVKDAILGLIIRSANDAAVALGEHIAGSEEKFALMMNKKSKALGMHDSNFYNASGWHHPKHKTTATDLVKLTLAIERDHPAFYPLFSKTEFDFRGAKIKSRNKIVTNYVGAKGMKTGFTCPAGFNIITTASKGSKSLIGIVTGGRSPRERDQKMTELLDKHFGVINRSEKKTIPSTLKNTKIILSKKSNTKILVKSKKKQAGKKQLLARR